MLEGVNASDGIGIGIAQVAVEPDLSFVPTAPDDPKAEEKRYENARDAFVAKTEDQIAGMRAGGLEEEAEIMQAHIDFATDDEILSMVTDSIESGMCAEQAVSDAYDTYYTMFSNMEDQLFRERAADVADVKKGLLATLLGKDLVDLSVLPENTIVVVADLTPSMTATIDKAHVAGIVTETGGRTSHSAIIARALEIPAVLSVPGACDEIHNGDTVVVNGTAGHVHVDPTPTELEGYRVRAQKLAEEKAALEAYRGKPTVTADGDKVLLVANIGNPDDANGAAEHDAEGIGLFRSEFLFMDATELPSEDDQFSAYQKVAIRMKGQPVIIRTLDVGGDKEIPYLDLKHEDNPFMGFRAVRYCLANPDQYKVQLRALLRASAFGDIKIMLPLVTCIDEVRQAKALIEECKAELRAEGTSFNENIEVGTMIETPAASLIADDLAEECDFFSIGTNDLIGYTMCADRGNDRVSYLYSVYQPAVLRSLKRIIGEGNKAGIMVGMCGEAAADPLLVPVLLSFGLDEFSVSAPSILRTRKIISQWTKAEADALAEKVLTLKTESEVKAALIAAAKN
ncbi:MAG: phosphoenolpyruvate--protein phosphotransferase [Atopobiaceae bacterium]|jgi:phosphotransferase system enzyme I (PtsI)|nr:phosphoenolpyruvate--protein phosphotransferase [Atopobiaceae bacterium]MCH4119601.1 phosphoenolpyruvate--protein phosphotransferase [Atopobiaceae bacterium]MCI1318032.1 phosphoenolpyruvate--protein phosphotransferase [Atopobiaceae bacterium]MCI1389636.1 phosphoenolpyruvate--protein phosphotransferase [Atopobiaceae bacterium]MCI1431578.1 phosphoenolpyruvate--protein phosphotransferase [Atopobiaceae bacterium]